MNMNEYFMEENIKAGLITVLKNQFRMELAGPELEDLTETIFTAIKTLPDIEDETVDVDVRLFYWLLYTMILSTIKTAKNRALMAEIELLREKLDG